MTPIVFGKTAKRGCLLLAALAVSAATGAAQTSAGDGGGFYVLSNQTPWEHPGQVRL